ncbi:GNAT family N-acetyltransferase [Deefgea sp. CFH1-16]|uniref:GNAT family N-acetyltransferase n=1 Tax=Deefgea sp. CFH1-16 TaxID=2675457 RepID=UPI0015F37F58|nr:GNAT family N-acetyltransferase [Deefgea sp. CFH1-16]MBM5574574.1 GNAT family N-acetyltransferase [Deefgea sp. CFH1-16]
MTRIALLNTANDLSPAQWAQLARGNDPFLSREFLGLAESTGAASADLAWQPVHVVLQAADESPRAFLPLYLRQHSFGDFSRDWQWDQAWQSAGLAYYPKLVSAIPFTPSPGPRCVLAQGAPESTRDELIAAAIHVAQELKASSWQCLFVQESDRAALENAGMLLRGGVQFHWKNRNYADFDDFLATFTAMKRKKLNRERRYVSDAGLRLATLHGDEIDAASWQAIYRQYADTFRRYGNHPAFSLEFFQQLAAQIGRAMVVFVAYQGDDLVASAICYRSDTTLFGRHWGADIECPGLHFELCYYRGIAYAIEHGLRTFEPGAQGEHKLARGFEPVMTWGSYWIANPRMRHSVAQFIAREAAATEQYQLEMSTHLPFRLES